MSAPASKFKVADLSLAAFGRKEIELAEASLIFHFIYFRLYTPKLQRQQFSMLAELSKASKSSPELTSLASEAAARSLSCC
jgi:hypothetical protein